MRFGMTTLAAVLLALTLVAEEDEILAHTSGEPIDVTAKQLLDGECDFKFVRLTGTITDVIHDEVNPEFRFFIICSGSEVVYAPTRTITEGDETLMRLIGAEVSVCGTCDYSRDKHTHRHQFRRSLYIWRLQDITVLKPAPEDPFAVEELGDLTDRRPSEVPRLGRRRVRGRVLAVWRRRNVLIQTPADKVMRLETGEQALPGPGEFIEAIGLPESDTYRINLARAQWRPAAPFACADDAPATNVAARTILTDDAGRTEIKPEFHGRLIRLQGLLRSRSSSGTLYLEDGSFLVPVDASALSEPPDSLALGSRLAVTGVCVMNVESWRPTAVFPRIDGFTLVPRTAEDIVILSRPPWWTAGRLLAVIGTLLAVIVGIIIWNATLRRLARRRGEELYRARGEKLAAELRTNERTRLAVELHDTISQNLTGISMQIDAAANFLPSNREKSARHLSIATRALDSCRSELRNCIWDLRNGSLETSDMNDAIRSALAPYVGDAHLSVRLDLRRAQLSENTVHVLIHVIRELAANAIRHGGAENIRVAGATEGSVLKIAVTDDGSGFDPDATPGVSEGHYGLQGIRERIRPFDGSLTLVSEPGCGARARITLTLPEKESAP